jgi:hypothetical protein
VVAGLAPGRKRTAFSNLQQFPVSDDVEKGLRSAVVSASEPPWLLKECQRRT